MLPTAFWLTSPPPLDETVLLGGGLPTPGADHGTSKPSLLAFHGQNLGTDFESTPDLPHVVPLGIWGGFLAHIPIHASAAARPFVETTHSSLAHRDNALADARRSRTRAQQH